MRTISAQSSGWIISSPAGPTTRPSACRRSRADGDRAHAVAVELLVSDRTGQGASAAKYRAPRVPSRPSSPQKAAAPAVAFAILAARSVGAWNGATLTGLTAGGGCAAKYSAARLEELLRGLRPRRGGEPARRARRPPTTRPSTSSTTSARSSSRSTSSRRSSTTRRRSAASRRRTRSTTSSRWAARRCSRCRSPRFRRSCRRRGARRRLRGRRRAGARGRRAARRRAHDPRRRAEVRPRGRRHRPSRTASGRRAARGPATRSS